MIPENRDSSDYFDNENYSKLEFRNDFEICDSNFKHMLVLEPPNDIVANCDKLLRWREHELKQYWYYYDWFMEWARSVNQPTTAENNSESSSYQGNTKEIEDSDLYAAKILDHEEDHVICSVANTKQTKKKNKQTGESEKSESPSVIIRPISQRGDQLGSGCGEGEPPEDEETCQKLIHAHEMDCEEVANVGECMWWWNHFFE